MDNRLSFIGSELGGLIHEDIEKNLKDETFIHSLITYNKDFTDTYNTLKGMSKDFKEFLKYPEFSELEEEPTRQNPCIK